MVIIMSVSQSKIIHQLVVPTGGLSLLGKILSILVAITLLYLFSLYLWDKAGDARELEVRAEYEALAIKDKESKLANKVAGKELLETKTKETEIKYVDRVKEVARYIAAPSANTQAAASCVLTPDFIRVYNDESASSQ